MSGWHDLDARDVITVFEKYRIMDRQKSRRFLFPKDPTGSSLETGDPIRIIDPASSSNESEWIVFGGGEVPKKGRKKIVKEALM